MKTKRRFKIMDEKKTEVVQKESKGFFTKLLTVIAVIAGIAIFLSIFDLSTLIVVGILIAIILKILIKK